MYDNKEYDTPAGKKFLKEYGIQWDYERMKMFADAEKILRNGLDKLKEAVDTREVFDKLADIYVDTCRDVYNEKLKELDDKYHKIFSEMYK